MRHLIKRHRMQRVKALTDADQPGTFEALVSVFGNTDSDGDTVAPGAFTKTLQDGPKPIVYSHDWLSVPIGQTLEARETDEGLFVKARLFVADDEDHPEARKVYAAMKGGALNEFSWGGRVMSETREEADDGTVTWIINEVDLVEYGPCLKGANPDTRLVAVKSAADRIAQIARGDRPDDATFTDLEFARALKSAVTKDDADDTDNETGKDDETADVISVDEARQALGLPDTAGRDEVMQALATPRVENADTDVTPAADADETTFSADELERLADDALDVAA